MSNSSWIESLNSLLTSLPEASDRPARLALLGIGNELNGDDAAGVLITRRLIALLPRREHLLVLEAGLAPENFTGPLRRFRPELVLLVDAGDFGGQPGEVDLIDWKEAHGFSASTHTLPPAVLAGYLSFELHCEIAILAVQAARTEFDTPPSPEVEQGIASVVSGLLTILKE